MTLAEAAADLAAGLALLARGRRDLGACAAQRHRAAAGARRRGVAGRRCLERARVRASRPARACAADVSERADAVAADRRRDRRRVRRRARPGPGPGAVADARAAGERRGRGGVATRPRARPRAARPHGAAGLRGRDRGRAGPRGDRPPRGRRHGRCRDLGLRRRDRLDRGRARGRSALGPRRARGGHRARGRSRRPPGAAGAAGRPGPDHRRSRARDRLPRSASNGSTRQDSRCICPSTATRRATSRSWKTAARPWPRSCTIRRRCATRRSPARSSPRCAWRWPTFACRPTSPRASATSPPPAAGSSRPATSSAAVSASSCGPVPNAVSAGYRTTSRRSPQLGGARRREHSVRSWRSWTPRAAISIASPRVCIRAR